MRFLFLSSAILILANGAARAEFTTFGAGVKRLKLELSEVSAKAIKEGTLSRGDALTMLASFDCPADKSQASLLIRPIEGQVEAGSEKSNNSATDADDSIGGSELKIAIDLASCDADRTKRVESTFLFRPSGKIGGAISIELAVSGAESASGRATYLIAIDAQGKLRETDSEKIYVDQIQQASGLQMPLNVVLPLSLDFIQKNASRFDVSKFALWDRIYAIGALSFPDPVGCSPSVVGQSVSWEECHRFKRHFKMKGDERAVVSGGDPEALRPLRATIDLVYNKREKGKLVVCDKRTVQTDKDGYFIIPLQGCKSPGAEVELQFKVYLTYEMKDLTGTPGTVRTVWRKDQLKAFDNSTSERTYLQEGVEYGVANYSFTHKPAHGEPMLGFLPVGNAVLLQDTDAFNWHRQVLSAYSSLLEMHDRLSKSIPSASYKKMFANGGPACKTCYTIALDQDWAYGNHGYIGLHQPVKDASQIAWMLSDTNVLSHEFGHSVHFSLASASRAYDSDFSGGVSDSSGASQISHHFSGQIQEHGLAFVEGYASTIGQYILNKCEGYNDKRLPAGAPQGTSFAFNMWNGDELCDKATPLADSVCSYHHFRWHMKRRGVAEGSAEWNKRLLLLRSVTSAGTMAGVDKEIISNQEMRVSQFGCDVLDEDTKVIGARVSGRKYLREFARLVGWALDGRDVLNSIEVLTYDSDPASENVHLSFPQFLEALSGVCPGCSKLPPIGDTLYPKKRLGAESEQSPQRFGEFLVKKKWATRDQVRDLLKANLMEVY